MTNILKIDVIYSYLNIVYAHYTAPVYSVHPHLSSSYFWISNIQIWAGPLAVSGMADISVAKVCNIKKISLAKKEYQIYKSDLVP
jgi:hypothetical protein